MILERKRSLNIEELSSTNEIFFPTDFSSETGKNNLKNMLLTENLYSSAIKEISTKLEIIEGEFQVLYSHNPIHHIEGRLKSPHSMAKKLSKNGYTVTAENIKKYITDMAGIRVICYYVDEVYIIAELLLKQNDVKLLKTSDYIKNPKPSGYRSLHIIVSVPVFWSGKMEIVPVEIQLRTIAMDFWASLEHQLRYKTKNELTDDLHGQLKNCAEKIAALDMEMQDIYYAKISKENVQYNKML